MTGAGPTTIIVVAKEPVPGRVKTRLSPPCTPEEAAALAEAALADTFDAVCAATVDRRVVVLDGDPGPWLPPGIDVVPQRDGPFAERLDAAWRDATGGVAGPTLQIGMDTPQVGADQLDEAIDRLRHVPAVLGPARDGGWWALGLRAPLPGAFEGVPMSTDDTGARQRERLRALLGTEPEPLALLCDVDHFTDAREVALVAPRTRFARLVRRLGH